MLHARSDTLDGVQFAIDTLYDFVLWRFFSRMIFSM